MPEEPRPTGPLRPVELATAAVMAGVSVTLVVIGWFLPHLGPIAALAVVPLGVVAHRHRLRALLIATFAAALLSFMVVGTGTVSTVVECAAVGGLVGIAKRRQWSVLHVVGGLAVIGPSLALVSVGLLALFHSLRKLTIQQIRNTWRGIARIVVSIPGTRGAVHAVDGFVADALQYWWLTVGALVVIGTAWFGLLAWLLLGEVLARTAWIRVVDRLDFPPEDGPIAPVPVTLTDVHYRYPGGKIDALAGVSLTIDANHLVALVGDNGSGKSTVARILAGLPPASGTVTRAGWAGLGRSGGTAVIMQHPDSQVLGVRVADDVVWGLHDSTDVDVPALLEAVGLAGMDQRETSTLSGGELQRLAVAAALARRPDLLISDESTAMVDSDGRARLTGLLASLPAERSMTVVHITHRLEETARADRRFRLAAGQLVDDRAAAGSPGAGSPNPNGAADGPFGVALDGAGRVAAGAADGAPGLRSVDGRLGLRAGDGAAGDGAAGDGAAADGAPGRGGSLRVRRVSHTYSADTPWAQPALHDVDIEITPGEGVLIVGGNGSGKSTLAWILAGVLTPTSGACLLGSQPVTAQVGAVGLAFQHARLQLQRSTVAADVRAAGASDDEAVERALAAVGLDADAIGSRRIDELSGGQQRRVALAGILARNPAVVVLDEPMAGLDDTARASLVELLSRLRRTENLTVVVISHDFEGMEQVCDRMVRLERGRVVADGPLRAGAC